MVRARACVCCTAALHCGMTAVRQLGGARFALSLNRYERKKNVALAIDVRRSAPAGSVRHTPIRETWRSWRTRVHQQRRVCRCACECMCVQAWAEARRRLLVGAHPVSTLVIAGAMPSCCDVATLQRVAAHPVSTPVIAGAVPAGCCAALTLARARPAAMPPTPLLWFTHAYTCAGGYDPRVAENVQHLAELKVERLSPTPATARTKARLRATARIKARLRPGDALRSHSIASS